MITRFRELSSQALQAIQNRLDDIKVGFSGELDEEFVTSEDNRDVEITKDEIADTFSGPLNLIREMLKHQIEAVETGGEKKVKVGVMSCPGI